MPMPVPTPSSPSIDQLVRTTHLEMTDPAEVIQRKDPSRLSVLRAEHPSPELNLFFYSAVGSKWAWYSRLLWSRERWLAYVSRPELETWVGYLDGSPVGYFELEYQADQQVDQQVEVVHFGVLPSFIGRGLGQELLAAAIDRAWRNQSNRIWLHTCDLDHPRALPNYQAQGFRIFKVEEAIESLPNPPRPFWPTESAS